MIDNPGRAGAAIDEALDCLRSVAPTVDGVVAASAIALAMVNLERFDDAVALLDGIDLPPAANPPPDRFRLTLGWAFLGSGDSQRALACFLESIPTPALPRLERAIARARRQVEHLAWPDFSGRPTPAFARAAGTTCGVGGGGAVRRLGDTASRRGGSGWTT